MLNELLNETLKLDFMCDVVFWAYSPFLFALCAIPNWLITALLSSFLKRIGLSCLVLVLRERDYDASVPLTTVCNCLSIMAMLSSAIFRRASELMLLVIWSF